MDLKYVNSRKYPTGKRVIPVDTIRFWDDSTIVCNIYFVSKYDDRWFVSLVEEYPLKGFKHRKAKILFEEVRFYNDAFPKKQSRLRRLFKLCRSKISKMVRFTETKGIIW